MMANINAEEVASTTVKTPRGYIPKLASKVVKTWFLTCTSSTWVGDQDLYGINILASAADVSLSCTIGLIGTGQGQS
jgi:hypothetical protein